jgi:hypothetical protein
VGVREPCIAQGGGQRLRLTRGVGRILYVSSSTDVAGDDRGARASDGHRAYRLRRRSESETKDRAKPKSPYWSDRRVLWSVLVAVLRASDANLNHLGTNSPRGRPWHASSAHFWPPRALVDYVPAITVGSYRFRISSLVRSASVRRASPLARLAPRISRYIKNALPRRLHYLSLASVHQLHNQPCHALHVLFGALLEVKPKSKQ